MIDVEELDGGFRAVDAAKNEVTVEIDDWEPGGEELEIGYDVDETITGSGTEIRLPESGFLIHSTELDDPRMLNMNERVRLPPGDHTLRLGASINVFVRVESDSTVDTANTNQGIRIGFPQSRMLTVGFKQFNDRPDDILRVPPSAEGVGAAISICASRHGNETPDRSFPSERPRLPHLEVDDDILIDDRADSLTDDQPILRTPPHLPHLFNLAPLAFYVGAGIKVENRDAPILEIGDHHIEFSSKRTFTVDVASLLRRVFFLDCIVREVGPRRLGIREFELL